jgi:hypothetical protein
VVGADFTRPRAFKVPRESAAHPARPGLSFPVQALLDAAPDTEIFWIVRHPLDAICSLRVGIAKDWDHHPRPPDWRAWLDRTLLERCAHHWSFLNQTGFAQVEDRAAVVRFEDMVLDPRSFARSVCAKVGIDVARESAVIENWAGRVQNTHNTAFVEARTSRGHSRRDHAVRIGRWRENLTAEEVDRLWPLVSEPAKRFGYLRDGRPPPRAPPHRLARSIRR